MSPQDRQFLLACRARLKKTLRECEEVIAQAEYVRQVRPEVAPAIAPDEFIDMYAVRDWAREALVALDDMRPLPPAAAASPRRRRAPDMSDRPRRIRRSRRKGWRLPPGSRCVTKPGPFKNPFDWRVLGRPAAVAAFRDWILAPERADLRERVRRELRGLHLACYCPLGDPCHAEVLIAI